MRGLYSFRASVTIEMAYLMPIIFGVFVLTVNAAFYYHDKNLMNGAVQETVSVGVQAQRNPSGEEIDLEGFCRSRLEGKLIFFSLPDVSATASEDLVQVEASVHKGRMGIQICRSAKVPRPENKIRLKRKIERMGG